MIYNYYFLIDIWNNKQLNPQSSAKHVGRVETLQYQIVTIRW